MADFTNNNTISKIEIVDPKGGSDSELSSTLLDAGFPRGIILADELGSGKFIFPQIYNTEVPNRVSIVSFTTGDTTF